MSHRGQNLTLESLQKQREVLANLIQKFGKDSEVTRLQKVQVLEIQAGLKRKGIDPGAPISTFSPREELAALKVRRERVAKDNLRNTWAEAHEPSSHNIPPIRAPMIAPLRPPKETPRKRGK